MASLSPQGFLALTLFGSMLTLAQPAIVAAQQAPVANSRFVQRVQAASERTELTVKESRILTLDKRIPEFQVINPEILGAQAVSPNQIQIVALATGITQINLSDEDGNVFAVDVVITGDCAELTNVLSTGFPDSSLEVLPIHEGVMISGIVSRERDIPTIMQIASGYYTNVIDNMEVGGMHQVLLHVKIIEVSRTKFRSLGFQWDQISGVNTVSVSPFGVNPVTGGGITFKVTNGGNTFNGFLEAMCRASVAKTLAEPTLVALSGRAASFRVGGEVGYVEGQTQGGSVQIGWKQYGTEIQCIPLVLGNGKIQLEIRPTVSSLDRPNFVNDIPAIKESFVDTSVELQAGETLALAGLIETRIESERRGIPWVSEVPYLGTWFRQVEHRKNEVELLILVTPELVSGMSADQVPKCLPGSETTDPNDWQLYMRGHVEVPKCCADGSCEQCSGDPGMIGTFDGQSSVSGPGAWPAATPRSPIVGPTPRRTLPAMAPPASRPTAMASQPRQALATSRANVPLPTLTVSPSSPQDAPMPPSRSTTNELPGFMGPIGYDVAQ